MKEFSINMPGGAKQLFNAFEAEEQRLATEDAQLLSEFAVPDKATQIAPYPVEVWEGTLYGEFARRCTSDNDIPQELFIECLKTLVGSGAGARVFGDRLGMEDLRQYTVLVAPPQSGKDTAIGRSKYVMRGAVEFDAAEKENGFLSSSPSFTHIGTKPCNFGSEVAAINAGLVCPRVIATPLEFGSVLDKSGIAGSGQALLARPK